MICYVFKRRRRIDGRLHESREWFGALRLEWEHGQTRKWSLGTTDKREAERLLHAERVRGEKIHHGLLPTLEAADVAHRPLNEVLDAFLNELRASGRAEATVAKYRNMRVLFARCRWRKIADVTARSFCEWRAHSDLSGKSENDLLKNTRGFFGWLRRRGMAAADPLEFVEPVKLSPKQFRRAETPERLQRLLSVASPERAAVYLTALYTGLRRRELQSLTLGDFEMDAPKPFVRVPASISKNRKEATLWLRPEVVAAVRSVLPANAAPGHKVFAGLVPRLPRFKMDLELAGIPFEDAQGRRFDLHALRVTFGTNLSLAGVTPRVAMELMRHSDIKLTMKIYTDPSQLPTAAAVASLPALVISGTQMGTQTGTQTGVAEGQSGSQAVAQ
jgi:integrase